MGLDLFAQTTVGEWTRRDKARERKLHQLRSLKGSASYALDAFGESALSEAMYGDMDSVEALAFAAKLHTACLRLEQKYANADPMLSSQSWSLDEALAAIREAADWYEQVGSLDCGVHAWS